MVTRVRDAQTVLYRATENYSGVPSSPSRKKKNVGAFVGAFVIARSPHFGALFGASTRTGKEQTLYKCASLRRSVEEPPSLLFKETDVLETLLFSSAERGVGLFKLPVR